MLFFIIFWCRKKKLFINLCDSTEMVTTIFSYDKNRERQNPNVMHGENVAIGSMPYTEKKMLHHIQNNLTLVLLFINRNRKT